MSEPKVNGSGDHAEANAEANTDKHNESAEDAHDPQFVPIVYLPEIHIPPLEEHEDEMIKLRAKLYRFDNSSDPPEWKERGTGEMKMLRHRDRPSVRIVMRRDKTLKICANHFVGAWMELKPNCGSEKAWVWSVNADYADEEAKPELLAARFASPADAKAWFDKFEEAKAIVKDIAKPPSEYSDAEDDSDAESDSGLGSEKKTESKSEEQEKKTEENTSTAEAATSELADQLSKVTVNSSGDTEKK